MQRPYTLEKLQHSHAALIIMKSLTLIYETRLAHLQASVSRLSNPTLVPRNPR